MSPRLVQLLHGWPRSHFSLRCLHGAHESGTRLRFLTTRNRWLSGDAPFEEVEEGGVGWIGEGMPRSVVVEDLTRLGSCAVQREAVANRLVDRVRLPPLARPVFARLEYPVAICVRLCSRWPAKGHCDGRIKTSRMAVVVKRKLSAMPQPCARRVVHCP